MKYSARLQAALQLMEPCALLADIGCDHGYLCILAAEAGICREALAVDLRSGPLEHARANIALRGLNDRIHTVLSDGFASLEALPDCAAVCGMGGLLIREILEKGRERLSGASQLILGPHSEELQLREYLAASPEFFLYRETAVLDAGKYYALLDVRRQRDGLSASADTKKSPLSPYGDPGLQTDLPVWRERLLAERERTRKALDRASEGRSPEALERTTGLQAELQLLDTLLTETI